MELQPQEVKVGDLGHWDVIAVINLKGVIIQSKFGSHGAKGEYELVKDNMFRDDDMFGMKVKVSVHFIIQRVPKEHARSWSRLEFLSGGKVRVAKATENIKVRIRWVLHCHIERFELGFT